MHLRAHTDYSNVYSFTISGELDDLTAELKGLQQTSDLLTHHIDS